MFTKYYLNVAGVMHKIPQILNLYGVSFCSTDFENNSHHMLLSISLENQTLAPMVIDPQNIWRNHPDYLRIIDNSQLISKQEKSVLARLIIKMVHETTGRFLKDEGEGWVEIDETQARAKVAHSFRNLRKKKGEVLGRT